MAIPHFFLPVIFDWSDKLAEVHAIFPWALGVFNFSWSLMLLILSLLVLSIAKAGPVGAGFERRLVGGLGAFWLIHGAYLVFNVAPIPAGYAWISKALMPFPIVVSALHFIPLWMTRKQPAS
ncbi:MAG: hypothetical protein ACI9HE_004048 [Planctomycetota bacterium]|jgi:hypothetical protein